jgi:hypothetical protein
MTRLSDYEAALVWKMARSHGWSEYIDIEELARKAAVEDEAEARQVARNELPKREYIIYRQDTDRIRFAPPPLDAAAEDLSDAGYLDIDIRATFGDYQDTV